MLKKVFTVFREEFSGFHLRLWLVQPLVRMLPNLALSRLRGLLYRLAGFHIHKRAFIFGRLVINGGGPIRQRLFIGEECIINDAVFFNLGAPIRLGKGIAIGPRCLFITESHRLGRSTFRAGDLFVAPIEVGDGAWLGSCVTVLPGVTIGRGAVVAAGAVVTKDIPANTVAAGVPAKVAKELTEDGIALAPVEEAVEASRSEITATM